MVKRADHLVAAEPVCSADHRGSYGGSSAGASCGIESESLTAAREELHGCVVEVDTNAGEAGTAAAYAGSGKPQGSRIHRVVGAAQVDIHLRVGLSAAAADEDTKIGVISAAGVQADVRCLSCDFAD